MLKITIECVDGIGQNKLKTAKKLLDMLYANKRYYKSDKFTKTKSYWNQK